MGSHYELMQLKGVYYELVATQTKDKSDSFISETCSVNDINVQSSRSVSVSSNQESEDDRVENNFKPPKPNFNWAMQTKDESKVKLNAFHELFDQNSINELEYPNEVAVETTDQNLSVKEKIPTFHFEKKLLSIQKSDWIWLVLGCLSQIIFGGMLLGLVLLFTQIFEIFSECDFDKQLSDSLMYMSIIFSLGGITMVITMCLNYSFALTGARLTKKLRVLMFESMLKQEVAFHDLEENRSSVLATLLATSTQYCRGLTSDKIGLLCQGFSCIGLSVLVSFIFNWKLAFAMLGFVPISFVAGTVAGKASIKGKSGVQEAGRLIIEIVDNIRTVVSLTREEYFLAEFKLISNRKFKKSLAMFHVQAVFYSLAHSLTVFIQTSAFR